MARIRFAEYLLEEVESSLKNDNLFEACDHVVARFSGHGPAWTWEVDTLHRKPADVEEQKVADSLDKMLLSLVFSLEREMTTIWATQEKELAFCRLSQFVLFLNRLGDRAPKKQVNGTIDLIEKLAMKYGEMAEQLYALVPFLPGVSYFH